MDNAQLSQSVGSPNRRKLLACLGMGAAGGALGLRPLTALAQTCPIGDGASTNPNGFRVFRDANVPASNNSATISGYKYWPTTDNSSVQTGALTSAWTGGGPVNNWPINAWYYVWANRGPAVTNGNPKPNPVQSPYPNFGAYECRVAYSSITNANAATQSLIRYWLGRADWAQPWASALNIPLTTAEAQFVTYNQMIADPSSYFKTVSDGYLVATDLPWLPSGVVTTQNPAGLYQRQFMMPAAPAYQDAPGIVLDYECQDVRSDATTTAFIQAICSDIHASSYTFNGTQYSQVPGKIVLYCDRYNSVWSQRSGLDANNMPILLTNTQTPSLAVDLMAVMLSGTNPEGNVCASYLNQLGMFKGGDVNGVCTNTINYNKLFLIYDLGGGLSDNDAQFAYTLLKGTGPSPAPAAVWFWYDYATGCSTSVNSQISGVLEGNGTTPTSLSGYTGALTPCYSNLP